jgi:hypothetical protein
LNAWTPFNTNLPNARVTQLKIQYPLGKLDACLYGRGIWESNLYVTSSTGIAKANEGYSFEIYPNPFSSILTLETEKNLQNATVTVSNYLGQTVREIKNINGRTTTLSRDGLINGLYYVQLTEENKIIGASKVIIID